MRDMVNGEGGNIAIPGSMEIAVRDMENGEGDEILPFLVLWR